jgi:hypothetical protein
MTEVIAGDIRVLKEHGHKAPPEYYSYHANNIDAEEFCALGYEAM